MCLHTGIMFGHTQFGTRAVAGFDFEAGRTVPGSDCNGVSGCGQRMQKGKPSAQTQDYRVIKGAQSASALTQWLQECV